MDKTHRILDLYAKFINGEIVNKYQAANIYGVNEKSIQRDIDDIRSFVEKENNVTGTIIYDRIEKGYRLENCSPNFLTKGEILAVCKILLDSRAFTKKEMSNILKKLIECCASDNEKIMINELIRNEEFHYIEPRHHTNFTDRLWEIGKAIRNGRYIEIDYFRTKDKSIVKRKLKPVAILFSEYYFYLTAFIDNEEVKKDFDVINDSFPTIYRIDRIKTLKLLEERFHIPYKDRFEEGEFRKRVQFMYGGRLQKIKFKYNGPDIDAILDRLPTAEILDEQDGTYTVYAEVFGKGIDMWLKSQGDYVTII